MASDATEAIAAARAVMDAHLSALNSRDAEALADTLHFPHYRLSSGWLQTWEGPARYFDDFRKRAGEEWHHTAWDRVDVIAASEDKVHLDVHITRFREDGSALASFRSLWVIARLNGRWAAQLRSSFGV